MNKKGKEDIMMKLLSFQAGYKEVFRNPRRKAILLYLKENKDQKIIDLSKLNNLSFRNTEEHVKLLKRYNLITKEKIGKFTKINLNKKNKDVPIVLEFCKY